MFPSDCLFILFASLCSALFAEAISWLLIYRTDDYQRLKNSIEKLQAKLDKKKEGTGADKTNEKKVERFNDQLSSFNKDMIMIKMKSTFAVGITMVSLFAVLNSSFDGRVVAMLPFEPFSLIRGITHRGLPGTDFYQCSMVFFYIISSLSIRANLQKLLGTTPPKQQNTGQFPFY